MLIIDHALAFSLKRLRVFDAWTIDVKTEK
jgi:hypothetical protein